MKARTFLMTFVIVLSVATFSWAEEGHGHHEHKGSMMGHMNEESSSAFEVGNKVCPISGQKVGEMGPAVKVEHDGKVYNLCCAGCVASFKEDPEKYIKIIEESMGQKEVMGESHDHDKHEMGEMDFHTMKDKHGEEKSHSMEVAEDTNHTAGEVQEFHLEAYQHGYSPEQIVVKKGNTVKLHATSRDVPHGIFIKEYGINVPVKKGSIEEIEFVANKVGEFDILCSVYCGRGHHSMKSKLIVEE